MRKLTDLQQKSGAILTGEAGDIHDGAFEISFGCEVACILFGMKEVVFARVSMLFLIPFAPQCSIIFLPHHKSVIPCCNDLFEYPNWQTFSLGERFTHRTCVRIYNTTADGKQFVFASLAHQLSSAHEKFGTREWLAGKRPEGAKPLHQHRL